MRRVDTSYDDTRAFLMQATCRAYRKQSLWTHFETKTHGKIAEEAQPPRELVGTNDIPGGTQERDGEVFFFSSYRFPGYSSQISPAVRPI